MFEEAELGVISTISDEPLAASDLMSRPPSKSSQRRGHIAKKNVEKVSVAVLVDLVRHAGAGGHVKAWERFAEAATKLQDDLDLTVYFLGDGMTETVLSNNVRLRTVPPAFGTATIPWLKNGGGDTDLASYNPHLARQLLQHDVFHATSAFAFAKTAWAVAQAHDRPMVSSVHTDAGKFAKVYTGEIIERLVGSGLLGKWLIDSVGVPEISARNLDRARDQILGVSDRILVSNPNDADQLQAAIPTADISFLRRGIDKDLFSPEKRDRAWLYDAYDVQPDLPIMLFAGRVDESKHVLTVAKAARALIDEGQKLHLMIAGEGSETSTIAEMLGAHVTLAGNVAQDDLARLMASADLFAFPSESETVGNVVIEAKASGLPVILTKGATTSQLVSTPGYDGLLSRDCSVEAYVDAARSLLVDPDLRTSIGQNARKCIETHWPDWTDVLVEDLLPIWREVRSEGDQKCLIPSPREGIIAVQDSMI